VTPSSGPAAGGTATRIDGFNLNCPVEVFFGNAPGTAVTGAPGFLDCGGAITEVKAKSPAGSAGASVPVTVKTVESFFTGSGRGTSTATFTYTN
jgi:hypothetical protein